MAIPEAQESLRIDKWLWYARITKSRTLAQKLAVSGHVRLNKDKIAAAKTAVKPGDVLTITMPRRLLILKVLKLGTRRGPAPEAQLLYEDMSPPPPPKETQVQVAKREAGAGRPTKRDRRQIARIRGFNEIDPF
ncbi:Heat shock protein 15 [Pseudovibrio sp. W64]|uniref:RNA-binding S4 domain-containing protein n=1 Tax=unclassified Pseudovibrio TaxID=2627060 RepID=UPI0007AE3CA5|nr:MULTISPECIES: RNA-binding S4 domain-containing protein [unclassified Pseudovibrio]KZK76148.1 Heat shock protein 15 [Pseudovibrio sp. Ad46]KZK83992.1 Heat shock protein 15 [Pseudovibrio sp. W64]KZK93005.1 Heat shock protein 15 [Pseudovibrio sp. W74]KZK98078.1 Heat shock protein 15 [Pseudovibrio sp. Ad5]KZL04421.1 Heat shock protein 15 [Pseudovibrio sp. Ad14]